MHDFVPRLWARLTSGVHHFRRWHNHAIAIIIVAVVVLVLVIIIASSFNSQSNHPILFWSIDAERFKQKTKPRPYLLHINNNAFEVLCRANIHAHSHTNSISISLLAFSCCLLQPHDFCLFSTFSSLPTL